MSVQYLQQGDVIAVDKSWKVTAYAVETNTLAVGQNTKWSSTLKSEEIVYEGPSGNNVQYSGGETLFGKLQAKNMDLHEGDEYLVVYTSMDGGSSSGKFGNYSRDYPDGYKVTAIKLDADHTFNPENVRVLFYQTGSFNCMIPAPTRVGQMPVQYGAFKPASNECK